MIKSFASCLSVFLVAIMILGPAQNARADDPSFGTPITVASGITQWWAKALGDIDGDNTIDFVVITGNAHGGELHWYETNADLVSWTQHTIAASAPGGGTFACGDMEIGDIDNDGDIDVLGPKHVGEWSGPTQPTTLYWYENNGDGSSWTSHLIGSTPYFTKDVSLVDFDNDNDLDLAALSFEGSSGNSGNLRIFRQDGKDSWVQVESAGPADSIHEGMDAGDIDGDGDLDLSLCGFWYQNPGGDLTGTWTFRSIDVKWHNQGYDFWAHNATKTVCKDVNYDGRAEVFISHSEKNGYPVSWYESADPVNGSWTEHQIATDMRDVHTLQVTDIDMDGDYDVFAGENENGPSNSSYNYVRIFVNDSLTFTPVLVDNNGAYNGLVGDIDNDGLPELWRLFAHDATTFEMLPNETTCTPSLDDWSYKLIDGTRTGSRPPFGLNFGDVNDDGQMDIVDGKYVHINPGGDMMGSWTRVDLPLAGSDIDGVLFTDVDGDAYADIIAELFPDVYWLEATNTAGTSWTSTDIGDMPTGPHGSSAQGYCLADVTGDSTPEIVLTSSGVYYFEIPANPDAGNWPRTTIDSSTSEEQIYPGDMNRDGDIDLCGASNKNPNGPDDVVCWWENPGDGSGSWSQHNIGSVYHTADRMAMVDVNSDTRLDIVVSETEFGGCSIWWFEAPVDPTQGNWTKHQVTSLCHFFSMDVADMDNDGDIDVIGGQHQGSLELYVFENDGSGNFTAHMVDSGKESHLGSRVCDLDGDNDLDIVSIAYTAYQNLHLWINDGGCGTYIPDLTPPTVPTGLTIDAVTSSSVELSWTASTDEEGVVGYRVYRNSSSVGVTPDTVYTDEGLSSCQDYTYTVTAYDAKPNESGHSLPVSTTTSAGPQDPDLFADGVVDVLDVRVLATNWLDTGACITGDINADASVDLIDFLLLAAAYTGPDTEAPTVPTGLALLSKTHEQIAIQWTASNDNVDVAGYRVFRDGGSLGTTAGTSYTDTGLTAETEYSYTVSAFDTASPANESSESAPLVETTNPIPTDLKGYWPFSEGSGTTTADSSGEGHTGTITGATWTTGYTGFGNSLDFGGSDYVNTGTWDITTGSGITLAGWCRADSFASAGQDNRVISKATGIMEADHYWMLSSIASGSYTRLRFRLKTGSTTTTLIGSSGNLTTGTWFHAAATYDGSTMTLYKDGTSVGSTSKTGTVATNSSLPVYIGINVNTDGSSPNYRGWDGILDEIRVYDRGLSETEVQNLMSP